MTWSKLGIAAAVCGSMVIGYCIYFDRKRRTDPEFKKKLRESKFLNILSFDELFDCNYKHYI